MELPVSTQATILAAMMTPIVTVVSIILSHRYARRREIEQAQRSQEITFYAEFLKDYFNLLGKWKPDREADRGRRKELLELTGKTARGLILWGGSDTITKYKALRDYASKGSDDVQGADRGIVVLFGELLFAIRSELGHSNRSIQEVGLLSLFISDSEKL